MAIETDNNFDEIIKIIENNIVSPAPNQKDSVAKMYTVENLKIIIRFDQNALYCIKRVANKPEYIIITEIEQIIKIFNACESKIEEQRLTQTKQGIINVHPTR